MTTSDEVYSHTLIPPIEGRGESSSGTSGATAMTGPWDSHGSNPARGRPCPNCGAERGEPCTTATGIPMPTQVHRARRPRKARR